GDLYSISPDHPHDLRKAASLLRLSAAQGYVRAVHSLGLLLVNHPELKESGEDATALLRSSAEGGLWRSSATLGILAAQGKLLPRDNERAYQWLLIAKMQGGQEATRVVQDLLLATTQNMADDQRYSAETAAKDWVR